jgi:putative FmdB family regulatory protein
MPTYDYKCPNCEIVVEFMHKVDEPFVRICGECLMEGKNALMKKQVSKAGIQFKGSGFYETDYKGK